MIRHFLFLILIAVLPGFVFASNRYQAHADIYEAAKAFVTAHVDRHQEFDIAVAPLDSRLQLPDCTGGLAAFAPSGQAFKAGRLTIGVRCTRADAWSVYTSVTLKQYTEVWVLARPVRRGQQLAGADLALEKREVSTLRGGYIDDKRLLENKQATRHLAAGTVLNTGMVAEPTLIKRGESILISASAPGFEIGMQGRALMDGIKGQSIRVKNVSSGRTLAARVVKPGVVSVMR
ncbi:MAG: flagellar basal body P-ring formation chaperone FlgA [Gammaproteobacteria bacterium]